MIGWIATLLISFGYLPQCAKILKYKSTKGLSLKTFMVLSLGLIAWTIHAITNNDIPLITSSLISLSQTLFITTNIIINNLKIKNYERNHGIY